MNEIAPDGVPASSAVVGVNAILAVTATRVERRVHETACLARKADWPVHEPVYVTLQNAPTFSFFDAALAAAPPTVSAEFAQEVATVFASLSEGQESLGSEFEAAWDAHADALYQS